MNITRRTFMKTTGVLSAFAHVPSFLFANSTTKTPWSYGLCTYLWGKDADLPTLIQWCEQTDLTGLELRVEHAHHVEPDLSREKRLEVRRRFENSPVKLIGFGTNEMFHFTDPAKVKRCVERSKAYLQLSADCGGSGIKVKPNDLVSGEDQKKTTARIAKALNELGVFAANLGQVVRLENHGSCAPIPIMKEIIEQVEQKNVGLCWNCNSVDSKSPGFIENFRSVEHRLADTMHIHEWDTVPYPNQELLAELKRIAWSGTLLFEGHHLVKNVPESLRQQRKLGWI